ncbi:MAG: hypothetical protein QOH49_4713 [Acidobacteriota bacterium]|jgi:uncharacterized protein (DUF1501 family)|nr:hypothetical protein [Acidobacteriota bacterium]
MSTSRRDFLRASACTLGGVALASTFESLGLVGAYAQAATDYRALVCIFLSGGNDCNNTIVPLDQTTFDQYTAVRGGAGLALAQSSLIPINPPSQGRQYGLHPNLSPEVATPTQARGLLDIWNQGRLAVVTNVGPLVEPLTRTTYLNGTGKRPLQLFSHSDQVNQWQSSIANAVSRTGWGGRLADKSAALNGSATFPQVVTIAGVSLFVTGQSALPLAINDSNSTLGASLPLTMTANSSGTSSPSDVTTRRAAFDALRALDAEKILIKADADTRSSALRTKAQLDTAPNTDYPKIPNTTLGRQLEQIARVIALRDTLGVKRQIFFCVLGGFDTHSSQRTNGGQDGLFTQLSQAMRGFWDTLGDIGMQNNVTTFTLSDFGRTFQPSGTGATVVGSDHGWGSHHFVMGGAVRGGNFYGTYPTLALGGPDDADTRGRWIPSTSVEQYAATLASWYGLSASDFPAVFPLLDRFPTPNLGFLT